MVNTEKFISRSVAEIKAAAGNEKVVMALSGGVDSSVCAAIAARAIGDNLIPIYIDTGLMRKGETDRIRTIFGNIHLQIVERHRHRYEVNPRYIKDLEKAGLVFSATNKNRMECLELKDHPFYFATQFHPEFKSRPTHPSPPYLGFVEACRANKRTK